MIQFNLLPDVKLEYIKTRYKKRMVMGISFAVTGFFLMIFVVLLLYVKVSQPMHIRALDRDINGAVSQINSVQDLDKILTVQNQLKALPGLHEQKQISSRLFDYLIKVTPAKATISDVTLDLVENKLTIEGNADELSTVNKFADTLKFTEYNIDGDNQTTGKAFSEVVLSSFSISQVNQQSSSEIVYSLEFKFDPVIFQNVKKGDSNGSVGLIVPKIISTRSETLKPNKLFEESAQEQTTDGAGQ